MRKGLRWSIAGVVGLIAVASLLVIPAFGDGPALGEVGVLKLHLNSDGDWLTYDPSTGPDLTQTLTETNCKLASTGDSLLSLVGSSSHSSKKPFAGLKDHRIGVGQNYEGTGEPCARINKDLGQVLTLGLTGSLAGQAIGYAEIDLGFKFNGNAVLQLKKGATLVGPPISVPCNGLSDCGPDSGGGDNERVILWLDPSDDPGTGTWQSFQIQGVFDTIVIKPLSTSHKGKSAAISLEGGFNGAAPGPLGVSLENTYDTLFKLVAPFDGELPCELPTTLDAGAASFEITRGNDTDGGCKGPVNGLLFNFESGVEGDRLFVDLVTEPVEGASLAQFIEVITWTYDNAPDVPGGAPQQRTLSYDDNGPDDPPGERVMPWCELDPRPLSSTSQLAMPVGHTSCLIESTSRVTLTGKFVKVDTVYNIGDGRRWN